MFSKTEISQAVAKFQENMNREGISFESDGDSIELTVQGETIPMWFNFMGIATTTSGDEVLRMTTENDAKWYILASMLDDIIHDLKHENETLKAQIEELESKCDQYRVQIDDMEAEEMAPSLIDAIDMEGGPYEEDGEA